LFLLGDIITYVRRIIKSSSNSSISDNLIIDYINRFWISDVDARMQLFDLKTTYQFQTQPGVDQYNMPLYTVQTEPGNQTIGMYPVYQGFLGPARINGLDVPFSTQRDSFWLGWANIQQQMNIVGVGDGTIGPYTLNFPIQPNNQTPLNPPISALLRGHIDLAGIMAYSNAFNTYQDPPLITNTQITANDPFIPTVPVTSVFPQVYITSTDASGKNVVVCDSGQFLADNVNCGLLMQPGSAPNGNLRLPGPVGANYSTGLNVVNYLEGTAIVEFPVAIPEGNNINVKCAYFQTGMPSAVLFYNNVITLRNPPDTQYTVELTAYLSPSAFLNSSQGIQFGYMCEYLARGAARKILSDTGDVEQFNFYEPFFIEQERLVWKRSQRQFTATRTQTIYSQGPNDGGSYNNY
jgi:hypothetical protein